MTERVDESLEKSSAAASFAAEVDFMRPFAPFSAHGDSPDMTSADSAAQRRDQALDWLLRVQQAPDDAQLRAALVQWCAADSANAQAYDKAERVWRLTGQLAPATTAQWPQPAVPPAVLPRGRPRRRRTWLGAAVAACLMLALAPSLTLYLQSDYRTAQGETRDVTLRDGSVVSLDSDSAIAVSYAGDRRDVRLLAGQAFFKVASDPRKPFHVRAEHLEVTVTGTAFNVELGAGKASVAVQEGSVNVADWHADRLLAQRLTAGDRLDYQAGVVQQRRFAPGQTAAWRNGQVIADDTPIAEVVAELQRYLPGLIVLRDDVLAGKRVTGVYDLRHPQAALRAVVQPHGGQVDAYSPWLLVLHKP